MSDTEAIGAPPVTQPLRDDFAAVEPVLRGLAGLVDRVRAGQRVHVLLLSGALTCLDAYQRRHDQKVEGVLLPVLKARHRSSDAGLADHVIRMHREARRRLAELGRAIEASHHLNAAIGQLAAECVTGLREHAAVELGGLFGVADRLLSVEDAAALRDAFEEIEEREARPGEARALRALAAAIDPSRQPATYGIASSVDIVAAHVMRPWPRAVRPVDTLARAVEVMDQAHVRELPVVNDGRLSGILSRSDLQAHAGHLEWTTVESAMTPSPVVVSPEQSLGAVSQMLLRGRFNAVPVVADNAALIGMISRSDLLRAVADHANGDGR